MSNSPVDYRLLIPTLASIGDWCTRNLIPDDNIPTPASIAKGIMEVTMTPYGAKKTYSQRKTIVEPAFGWIKENRNLRKLQRRGISHCQDEWSLICLTQNLRKVCSRGELKKFRELILQKKQEFICNKGGVSEYLFHYCLMHYHLWAE